MFFFFRHILIFTTACVSDVFIYICPFLGGSRKVIVMSTVDGGKNRRKNDKKGKQHSQSKLRHEFAKTCCRISATIITTNAKSVYAKYAKSSRINIWSIFLIDDGSNANAACRSNENGWRAKSHRISSLGELKSSCVARWSKKREIHTINYRQFSLKFPLSLRSSNPVVVWKFLNMQSKRWCRVLDESEHWKYARHKNEEEGKRWKGSECEALCKSTGKENSTWDGNFESFPLPAFAACSNTSSLKWGI